MIGNPTALRPPKVKLPPEQILFNIVMVLSLAVVAFLVWNAQKDIAHLRDSRLIVNQAAYDAFNEEGNALDTEGWQAYRNEEYGFELKYPSGWEFYQTFTLRGRCILPGESLEPMPPDSAWPDEVICSWEVQEPDAREGPSWEIIAWTDREHALVGSYLGAPDPADVFGTRPAFEFRNNNVESINFEAFKKSFRFLN